MRGYFLFAGLLLSTSAVAWGQDGAAEVVAGQPAPDFAMTGIDGKEIRLSELTSEGKNVVLMFSRAHW